MIKLHRDYETRSEVDLEEVGLDNYLRHPSTEILMMSWAFDDAPVQLWEPRVSEFPYDVRQALPDPSILKCAWNSTFEQGIESIKLNINVPCDQCCDPMIWARHLSMPGALDSVGPILGLKPSELKMGDDGDRLINKFCIPQADIGVSPLFGTSTAFFRDWETDPGDWTLFGAYCRRDTDAERAVLKKIAKFPLPDIEQRGWILDQKINQAGMPVDLDLVHGALGIAKQEQDGLIRKMQELTGLENPGSRNQMLAWVRTQGYPYNSLAKEDVARALALVTDENWTDLTPLGYQALKLRQQASKTSYHKYEAILLNIGADQRLRNQFSFLGASRAGRWTGHTVQLQNLPRPTKEVEKNLPRAIELLRAGNSETLAKEFSSTMDVVASCIRSAFKAPSGKKLVVCDLNAIENRGLGWVARSETILDVFRQGKCPYLDFATKMYKVPYDSITIIDKEGKHKAKDADASGKRQIAKPAVLGCGYGLGGGDEVTNKDGDKVKTGLWGYGEAMGVAMEREEAHLGVRTWRENNPEVAGSRKDGINGLWNDLEQAAVRAITTRRPQRVGPVLFECFGNKLLRILLPSGRGLHYIRPTIEKRVFPGRNGLDDYEKDNIYYDGINQETRQWVRVPTYGGKLTENIVQAIARDLLLHSMLLADKVGFEIIGHCHDEIITLVDEDSKLGIKDLQECMVTVPDWAPGLPLGAEGYEDSYYHK